ncbi:MAG: Ig-like domain-containing protein [Actinomycetota bacterium]
MALNTSVWKGVGYPTDLWPALSALDPGAGGLAVADMNSVGEVVGTYHSGFARSFSWKEGSAMESIGPPPAYNGFGALDATGIDDDGSIVGFYGVSSTSVCGSTNCSFIVSPDGVVDLITNEAPLSAQGIDGGLVVGAGTWTEGGGYVAFPSSGLGYDANSSGTIVGHIAPGDGTVQAVYWPGPGSTPIDLGRLPGDTMSQARAINDDGWIVGWSGTSANPNVARRAFLWRPGMGMIDLGFYPGDTTADAFDINSAGVIVGTSGFGPAIWDINGVFAADYPPKVELLGDFTVAAGQLLSETINISDLEGDAFTAVWSGLPAGANWDGVSQLTWQTAQGDEGSYPVTLTVTQDSQSLNVTTIDVTIEVSPPAPTLDPIGSQTVAAGTSLTFTATATPGTSGNPLSYSLTTPTAIGASIDPASGVFSWTPTSGQIGDHSVVVEVAEDVCNGDPLCGIPSTTDSEAITITVTGGDQPPVLTPIDWRTGEHNTISISRSSFLYDPDTPIDDITLTLEAGIDPVPPGAVINGGFEWTPGETDGGKTFEFTIRAADTSDPPNEVTAPVTITVVETNSPPHIDPVPLQEVALGDTLTLMVPATDPDIPADTLEFILFSGLGSLDPVTGEYTFTPTTLDSDLVVIEVNDGFASASTFFDVFVVDAVANKPPDAVQDTYRTNEDEALVVGPPGVLLNDTDAENDPMTAVLVDPPQHGIVQLEPSGAFKYEPDPDFYGTDAFTYYATDGVPSLPATVRISVDPVQDDPVLEPIGNKIVSEGFTLEINPAYSDPDGDVLDHAWLGDKPPNTVINGIYTFAPDETQGGDVYSVEFVVTDGKGGEARETFTITVVETNQSPRLAPIGDQQVFTGDTVTFDADATDPDLPVQALTYSLEGAPAGATIDPVSGVFSWVGATTGGHTFDVVVRDDWPTPLEDRREVTLLVIDPLELPNDVSIDLSVLAGDPDADGIVNRGEPVALRAAIAESNPDAPVGDVNVVVSFTGRATLVVSTDAACESFVINGNTVLSCSVGTVSVAHNLDIVVTLDDPEVYGIDAEVTSSANPETNVTNNTDSLTLEAQIRVFISELIGVSDTLDVVPPLNLATILEAIGVADLVDVVPPLNLQTILEAIAVGDLVDVVPPLTLATILEAIGVADSLDVVPPLNLATILENIAVTDGGQLVYDSDGSGIPDMTATAVDPITGEPLSELLPGDDVLVTGGGLLPNSTATVVLFSDPVHLTDVVTDADGVFAVVVTIPEDTLAGEHRIIVTGDWQLGGQLEIIFPIEVLGLCTILGTDSADFLAGTSGDDVICGFGGNDIIFGGGGSDIIFGGSGNDLILGGYGDDELFGEEGNDVIFGGQGNDHLVGGPGWDLLVGGRGEDTILQ